MCWCCRRVYLLVECESVELSYDHWPIMWSLKARPVGPVCRRHIIEFHTKYMIRIEFQFNSGPTHVNVGPIFHSNERLIIGNMRKPNSIKIEFVPPLTPHSWFHRTVPMSEVSMWQELSKKKTKESSSCHVETLTMERFLRNRVSVSGGACD